MKQEPGSTAIGGTPEDFRPLRIPTPASRGNPDANPARHIFVALGGGGSTALANALTGYARLVAVRPDLHFRPSWFPQLLSSGAQVLDREQMAEILPDPAVFQGWKTTSGFPLDASLTVDLNLTNWLHWLEDGCSAAVVWLLAAQGFFSRMRVRGVVFLFRNPLNGYASFIHPQRHGDLVSHWGESESESAIRLYARWWNETALEAVRLRHLGLDPLVLRFESLIDDLASDGSGLRAALSGWESKRRGGIPIGGASESLLRSLTGDLAQEIMGPWESANVI